MLESLQRRSRGRRLAPLLNRIGLSKAIAGPPNGARPVRRDGDFQLALRPRELKSEVAPCGRVSELLYESLDDSDITELESRLEGDDAEFWRSIPPEHRKSLALAYGVHYRVPGILAKTGLSTAMPPPEVHAMSHLATDAGGAYYDVDMFDEAIRAVDFELKQGMSGLDFGCSSGRLVRLLELAYPQVDWHGCDPNEGAIEWAQGNLPGIEFFASENNPPLSLDAGTIDVAVAISIWSHFSEPAALLWFAEMQRVLCPGGILIFTVQGWHGLQLFAQRSLWAAEDIQRTADDLYTSGFSYVDVFGPQGDHGVVNPDWGMAHLTPEWIATRLCPAWSILDFKSGRVLDHQDLVVIKRQDSEIG